jgi:hypothetical protein
MFLLILLSVLQICFIPGFIVFLFLNRKSNDSNILLVPVISFGLSLIINYIIVSFLAYFHFYTRSVLIILIVIELICLTYVFLFHKLNIEIYSPKKRYLEFKHEVKLLINTRSTVYDVIKLIFFILSCVLLILLLILMIFNFGKIFQHQDAIESWNRWAIDFCNNSVPAGTYHYPQLIPANWSISYVLCECQTQSIPRGLMPLFLIFMVYSFIIMGIKQRSNVYIFSIFFLYQGFHRLFWTDGLADVPVAFFSILVYICLSLIKKEDQETDKKEYIILSTLFVCGAAVTKQAGLFLLLVYPFLLILTKDKLVWTYHKILKFGFLYILMIIIIVSPFYLYAELAIRNGYNTSEIHVVTSEVYHGASYFERFINACGQFYNYIFTSKLIFIIAIFPFILSFTDKTFRLLNFSLVIPYFIVWAIFFSYGVRNAAIIIPYICLGIGVGLDMIFKRLQQYH